jgi:uncharacterized membrane protein
MAEVQSVFNRIKKPGKYSIFLVAGLLLIVWGLETPAGIFGKADAIGYAVCHRIDLRSFHIGLRQLPLCARCTGQYVGAVIGLLLQAVFARRRSGFPSRRIFLILGFLGLVYAVDGLNSYLSLPIFLQGFPAMLHLYEPSNLSRLLTGTGVGLAVAIILYPAFVGSVYAQPDPRPATQGMLPLISMLGLGLLADGLILTGSSFVLLPAALISSLGVILLLTLAYTIVILRIYKKNSTYSHFYQISLPLAAAFIITISQIALLDLIRFLITGTWGGLKFG